MTCPRALARAGLTRAVDLRGERAAVIVWLDEVSRKGPLVKTRRPCHRRAALGEERRGASTRVRSSPTICAGALESSEPQPRRAPCSHASGLVVTGCVPPW